MTYRKYPDEETVNAHIKRHEPLIIAIPFEGGDVLIAHVDDAFEHHILLAQFDIRQTNIDKYFRVIADDESADWMFVCPRDYRGIADRQKRTTRFYNDGFTAISEVLSDIGYFSDIRIPKRYRRHFEAMGDDSTYIP